MGYSTGSNPSATGKRVGKYLKSIPKEYPTYRESKYRKVKYRILPKILKRTDKKYKNLDKDNISKLKKYAHDDFYKNMVDWQVNLGNILIEGSLGVEKTLRMLKVKKNKTKEQKDRAHLQARKWMTKKLLRSKSPSYRKHVLGED